MEHCPSSGKVYLADCISADFHQYVSGPGQRSAYVIANAFRAGFHRTIHRAWPLPVGSSERVTL